MQRRRTDTFYRELAAEQRLLQVRQAFLEERHQARLRGRIQLLLKLRREDLRLDVAINQALDEVSHVGGNDRRLLTGKP